MNFHTFICGVSILVILLAAIFVATVGQQL